MEGAFVATNQCHDQTHAHERDGEGNRCDKHAPARPVGNGGTDKKSEPRQFQQDEQQSDDQHSERKQDESSGSGHSSFNHPGPVLSKESEGPSLPTSGLPSLRLSPAMPSRRRYTIEGA